MGNQVIVTPDLLGQVCVWVSTRMDVVVVLDGWFGRGATALYHPLVPARLVDTRSGVGGRLGALVASVRQRFALSGRGGLPVTSSNTRSPRAIARPSRVHFVTLLPKTRSGKVLRRSIQAICEGRDPGDLTTIDDPSTLSTRYTIGVDRIMFESDYPHGDGTWPDTQAVFHEVFGALPPDEIALISHETACHVFRHPFPPPGSPHTVGMRRR